MFKKISTFNTTDSSNNRIQTKTAFLRSLDVNVYPCGRRRSTKIGANQYHIPFDPEARLSTEYNNRHSSSVNSLAQSCLLADWDGYNLKIVLAGYLFNIKLCDQTKAEPIYRDENAFCTELLTSLYKDQLTDAESITKIYANIRLEETKLFEGFENYNTWILRDMSASDDVGVQELDLPTENGSINPDNFYFSGLAFSTMPLTIDASYKTRSDRYIKGTLDQHIFSLCLFEKNDSGQWQIHEPAKLPKIEHGATRNSVEINGILNAKDLKINESPVSVLKVVQVDSDQYQLQFSNCETINQ